VISRTADLYQQLRPDEPTCSPLDGKPSDDDPREKGPRLGDERTTLVETLLCHRLTLELECSGLDAEAMARP
jgi:hypothetical protein